MSKKKKQAKKKAPAPKAIEPTETVESTVFEEPAAVETDNSNEAIARAEKDAEIAELKAENDKLKAPKGIPTKVQKDHEGVIIRDDEIIRETLDKAILKDPNDFEHADRVAIEREIRRYIKRGGPKKDPRTGAFIIDPATGISATIKGGYRKGISDAQKKRCITFLTRLGRDTVNPSWDENLRIPGFEDAE